MFANKVGSYLASVLGAMLPDTLLLAGVGSLIYGINMMSKPGAFIAGGVAAIVLGLSAGMKK